MLFYDAIASELWWNMSLVRAGCDLCSIVFHRLKPLPKPLLSLHILLPLPLLHRSRFQTTSHPFLYSHRARVKITPWIVAMRQNKYHQYHISTVYRVNVYVYEYFIWIIWTMDHGYDRMWISDMIWLWFRRCQNRTWWISEPCPTQSSKSSLLKDWSTFILRCCLMEWFKKYSVTTRCLHVTRTASSQG